MRTDIIRVFIILGTSECEEYAQKPSISPSHVLSLIDDLDDIFCILDLDGKIRFLNRAFERKMGMKVEDMIGRKFYDFVPKETAIQVSEIFLERLNGKHTGAYEILLKNTAGEIWHAEVNAKRVGNEIVGIVRDITRRTERMRLGS